MSHPEFSAEELISANQGRKEAGEKVDLLPHLRKEIHFLRGKQVSACLECLPRDDGRPQKQEKPVMLLLHGDG
jgi:hypothetical protein